MIDYVHDVWYGNNVKSLGAGYLCDIFDKLELMKDFNLLSGSANRGIYEQELYKHMLEYNPTFDIGDLFGKKLSKSKRKNAYSIEKFTYYPVDRNVIDFSIPDRKYDIILDLKGALWHYANDCKMGRKEKKENIKKYGKSLYKIVYKRKKVISLLKHYLELMKEDNSKLIIDNYYTDVKKSVNAKTSFKNYVPAKYKYFVEYSTYEILNLIVDLDDIKNEIDTYYTSINEKYPLTRYMSIGAINKSTIEKIIINIETQMDLEVGNMEIVNSYKTASNKTFTKCIQKILCLLVLICLVVFALIIILHKCGIYW